MNTGRGAGTHGEANQKGTFLIQLANGEVSVLALFLLYLTLQRNICTAGEIRNSCNTSYSIAQKVM